MNRKVGIDFFRIFVFPFCSSQNPIFFCEMPENSLGPFMKFCLPLKRAGTILEILFDSFKLSRTGFFIECNCIL